MKELAAKSSNEVLSVALQEYKNLLLISQNMVEQMQQWL
jgi:hypothetical protein